MKTTRLKTLNSGSALLVSLLSVAILGSLVASSLLLLRQDRIFSARSGSWNRIVPYAEAGIEEALTQMNVNGTNLVANFGFELTHGKYLLKSRNIDDQTITVGISVSTNPVIVCQGHSPAPLSKKQLSRTFKVGLKLDPLFKAGIGAEDGVDLNGKNITVDSYDSKDPLHSTNSQYDPAKRKANGLIGTNSGLEDSFNAGNAQIYGRVYTGPGGNVKIGANGSVGDIPWHAAGSKGVQAGSICDDMNFAYFPIIQPFASAFAPGSLTTNSIKYDYVLYSGDYKIASPLKLNGRVLVLGSARVLVTGEIAMAGTDELTIAPGATLSIYMTGAKTSFASVINPNPPGNFVYYGLPGNTSISLTGNANFTGCIYAPYAAITVGGGGKDEHDICGAIVGKTVTMNGKFNFHFDEALSSGPMRGWIASSWDEITQTWDNILANDLELELL
jgi:hypothetical protein